MNGRASAVTAEVARKCAALAAKAYPPQVPGNPAAGLAKGRAQFKRDYFNKCVATGGNMDDDAPEHPPVPPSGGAASVPQRDRTSELSQSLCPLIQSVAAQNELPVEFFARLIWQESRLRPDAVGPVTRSGKRAQGIAQFMPATAAERFLLDAFDPAQALPKSAEFLRELRAKFGNLGLAAAAYNAGPQRVQDWLSGKRTLPSETLAYVRSVTGHSAEEWKRADARGPGRSALPATRHASRRRSSRQNPRLRPRARRLRQAPPGGCSSSAIVWRATRFPDTRSCKRAARAVRRPFQLLGASDAN